MTIPVPEAGQADHPRPSERARQLASGAGAEAQDYLRQYYTERASHRANHARRVSGAADVRYAEAFQLVLPKVVRTH